MEKINYRGWPNCYRLSNDLVDLIVTTDVGPRIIRYGFIGAENEFNEYEDMVGKTGGDAWRIYGGHRLWHSPEVAGRTYWPDNGPVKIEQHGRAVRLVQPVEATTGIVKEIDVLLSPMDSHVTLTHRLKNTNLWAVELAPWALSVMAKTGRCIIPLPPRGEHGGSFLPTSAMSLWPYTDLADPRWTWGTKYIQLRQDPAATTKQKIGLMNSDGWMAYARANHLFVKKFQFMAERSYPDFGSSVETYTDRDMLEVETVGPLTRLEPDQTIEHVEHWFLFKDIPMPQNDQEVDLHILPIVQSSRTQV